MKDEIFKSLIKNWERAIKNPLYEFYERKPGQRFTARLTLTIYRSLCISNFLVELASVKLSKKYNSLQRKVDDVAGNHHDVIMQKILL